MSKNTQSKYTGTIIAVRAIEDCIRATKKYTEGVGTMRTKHPVQGEGQFPSKKFVKYYEVYPEVELSWDMPADVAIDWLWGETPCIDVLFNYDYRENKAEVVVRDGEKAVKQLSRAIPGFRKVLATVCPVKTNPVPANSIPEKAPGDKPVTPHQTQPAPNPGRYGSK